MLAAARHLFVRQGFDATRAADVARRAGVSVGLVYHYYGNKQGLLQALAEEYSEAMAAAMFDGAEEHAPEVERLISDTFAFVRDGGALIGHFDQDWGTHGSAREIHRRIIGTALEGWLNRWAATGSIAIDDVEATAELLYGMVAAALKRCFVEERGRNQARWVDACSRAVEAVLGRG